MPTRRVIGVCYDAEYIASLGCPNRPAHATSIAGLGSVGLVPCSGFVHACGCVANGLERQMVRDFRERLSSGNQHFLQEVKARLSRYLFSEKMPAGVSLYVPGHGLVVYYNWLYAQRTMTGSIVNGVYFAPYTDDELLDSFPRYKRSMVFPFCFGAASASSNIGSLMGSTRQLHRRTHGMKGTKHCVCDVSLWVLRGSLPLEGDFLPCGCVADGGLIEGMRCYLGERAREISSGAEWEVDLSGFSRVLRRTGAVIHWAKGFGVFCLLSQQTVGSDLVMVFHPDRFEMRGLGGHAQQRNQRFGTGIDSLIQRGYTSALPVCRYLQFH